MRGISKRFPGVVALENVSLEIDRLFGTPDRTQHGRKNLVAVDEGNDVVARNEIAAEERTGRLPEGGHQPWWFMGNRVKGIVNEDLVIDIHTGADIAYTEMWLRTHGQNG